MRWLLAAALAVIVCQTAAAATVVKTAAAAKPGIYQVEIKYPQFPDVTPLVRFANQTLANWARGELSRFVRDSRRAQGPGKPQAPYSYNANFKVSNFSAARLVSVFFDTHAYTGGAHGNSAYVVFNFGMVEGKARRLALGDLFRPGAGYPQKISDAVIKKLKQDKRASFVADGEVKSLTPEQLERFVIEPGGLVFLIDPYEAGPYAAGQFQVKLTPDELGPDFRRSLVFGP